jgi:hypothetical protein
MSFPYCWWGQRWVSPFAHDVVSGRDGYFSFERFHHLYMMFVWGEMGIFSFESFCHSCLMLLVWGLSCGVFEIFSQGYDPFFITWKLDSKLRTRKFFELLSVSCRYFEIGTDCWRVDISATFSCAQCLPPFVYEILSFVFNIHSRSCNPVANCPHELSRSN